jgi:adenosylmethionine-8-amino-7-oxononanoate aminotransferase
MACIGEFERIVERYRDEVCAVVIEPPSRGPAG